MQAAPGSQLRALHARLASLLADDGDALALRVADGVAHVTALKGGHECRLQIDLRDPDAELVLATKLACFVDRVTMWGDTGAFADPDGHLSQVSHTDGVLIR